jgi:hypothetical protein
MKNQHIITLAGWLSFFITLFFGVTLYQTFNTKLPYEVSDSVTNITRQDGVFILTESRGFVGEDNQPFTVFRTIFRKDNAQHLTSIEGGVVINQIGNYVILRSTILPPHLNGAWCSRAEVYWKPLLSLRMHSATLPDLCFEIPKNDKNTL